MQGDKNLGGGTGQIQVDVLRRLLSHGVALCAAHQESLAVVAGGIVGLPNVSVGQCVVRAGVVSHSLHGIGLVLLQVVVHLPVAFADGLFLLACHAVGEGLVYLALVVLTIYLDVELAEFVLVEARIGGSVGSSGELAALHQGSHGELLGCLGGQSCILGASHERHSDGEGRQRQGRILVYIQLLHDVYHFIVVVTFVVTISLV